MWGLVNGRRKLDTPGNSTVLREMQRWEKTQALRRVVKHFIVAACWDREPESPVERTRPRNVIASNCTRPIFPMARQTFFSVCKLFQ